MVIPIGHGRLAALRSNRTLDRIWFCYFFTAKDAEDRKGLQQQRFNRRRRALASFAAFAVKMITRRRALHLDPVARRVCDALHGMIPPLLWRSRRRERRDLQVRSPPSGPFFQRRAQPIRAGCRRGRVGSHSAGSARTGLARGDDVSREIHGGKVG